MQTKHMWSQYWKHAKPVAVMLAVAGAFLHLQGAAMAAGPAAVELGAASPFALLAASGVTAVNSGLIDGDVGVSPAAGSTIQVTAAQTEGIIYATDASGPAGAVVNASLLSTAKGNLSAAYNSAAGRTPVPTGAFLNPGAGNIGGMNLGPGLYKFTESASAVGLDVTLTGGANDVWIFQVASNLYLGQGIYINLVGGAQPKNVFWQVGNTALLDEFSLFQGTILAKQSIAMMTNVSVEGRALTMNGFVSFGGSDITAPPGGTSTNMPPPSRWTGAVDLGGGWKWLSWFGYFIDNGSEWIWHAQHGWMYTASPNTTNLWFWTSDLGWFWTSSTAYPYLYHSSSSAWWWYQPNSSSPRWFYNTGTQNWESH